MAKMSEREMICILCPRGCHITAKRVDDEVTVTGNYCPRGIGYGQTEMLNPVRTVTSTVMIENARIPRLPVITDKSIPKDMIFDVMKEINRAVVRAPIQAGAIVIENVLSTGSNIIASRSMDEISA